MYTQPMQVNVDSLLTFAHQFDDDLNRLPVNLESAPSFADEEALEIIFHEYNAKDFYTDTLMLAGPTTKCCASGTCDITRRTFSRRLLD